jgi:hypothetical protein
MNGEKLQALLVLQFTHRPVHCIELNINVNTVKVLETDASNVYSITVDKHFERFHFWTRMAKRLFETKT